MSASLPSSVEPMPPSPNAKPKRNPDTAPILPRTKSCAWPRIVLRCVRGKCVGLPETRIHFSDWCHNEAGVATARVDCFGVHPNSARTEGGRMRIIGCDLHARQQTLAMLNTTTGEVVSIALLHEENHVREFYSTLPRPGARGGWSHRIDALVSELDGRAGNRMPGRPSSTDSRRRASQAETRSARCGSDSLYSAGSGHTSQTSPRPSTPTRHEVKRPEYSFERPGRHVFRWIRLGDASLVASCRCSVESSYFSECLSQTRTKYPYCL